MKKLAIALTLGLLLFAAPVMSQQIFDSFWVTVGSGIVLEGGGTGFNDGTWYVYPSMWINEWFYDHPFTYDRGKIIHIEFDWVAYDPACTTDITVAINWSTPAWSALGYGTTQPPLPGVTPEEDYIVRLTMMHECAIVPTPQHFVYDYVIADYNPEWVSIDVMGCNFIITNGIIVHECAIGTESSTWGSIKSMF